MQVNFFFKFTVYLSNQYINKLRVDVAVSPVSEDVLVIQLVNVIAIAVTTEGSKSNLFLYQTHDGQYFLSEEFSSFCGKSGNS